MGLILHESELRRSVDELDRAWGAAPTFAVAPERRGADPARWIERALAHLPRELATDHFGLLSSGSTGRPKLVVGRRSRAEALARLLHDAQASEPVRSTVVTLPFAYCYAFVNQWLWSRQAGRELVPTPGLARPAALEAALEAADGSMLCLIGPQVPLLHQHLPDRTFPGVIRVHFAGGPFPEAWVDEVRRLFPRARIFNNFGCAEAMPRLTVREVAPGEREVGIGRPLPGVELRSDDDGALLFRSPYRAVGWVDDDGFHPVADEDWIPTGDLGRRDPGGEWRVQGRRGQVFKRYGEKIALAQLLATVEGAWPGHATFVRERDPRGEDGHVLVLVPPPDEAAVRAILRAFRSSHPRTHWPLRIESVPSMDFLSSGKIDAGTLAARQDRRVHWRQRF
jgi:acyl-CoA synthetase (AMP-forming)/AMP-acid ligase II